MGGKVLDYEAKRYETKDGKKEEKKEFEELFLF